MCRNRAGGGEPSGGCSTRGFRPEREVLAVHDVHHVVVPALDFRFHEPFVHVEVERQQCVIAQRDALCLLEQLAALGLIDFCRSARHEIVVLGALVVRQVDAEVTLQILQERVRVVVVADPARTKDFDIAANVWSVSSLKLA